MSSPDEQIYRSDKVVKRSGTIGKDPTSPGKIGSSPHPDPILPISTVYESKPSTGGHLSSAGNNHTHTSHNRNNNNWMPKGYVLAIISILSVIVLSGSLAFVLSLGQYQITDVRGLVPDGNSVRFPANLYRGRSSRSSSSASRELDVRESRELDVRDAAWTSEVLESMSLQQQLQEERRRAEVVDDEDDDRVGITCDPRFAVLKVFMYDLPSEFHFGILGDFEEASDPTNVWPRNLSSLPRYPGGLYQQHSPEYWLTADVLTSNVPGRKHECTAVRVKTPAEADVIFVPFFASLSYNKYTKMEHKDGEDINEELQHKLVRYLKRQRPWQESGGMDHVIVIHHPNSLHHVRDHLRSAMYIVCDFGRYSSETANIQKDIVAPYKHVIPAFKDDDSTFDSRTTLLFFQGAIVRKEGGIIRQKLNELLKDEDGVHFVTGNTQSNGIKSATLGMRNSKFCLHLAGDTPSSNRLFDAIASHCVPVVISDELELPYEDTLDYSEFCLFIRGTDAMKKGFVIKLLRNIEKDEWTKLWRRLKEVVVHFEYQHPTVPSDAVNMVWKAIARRAPSVSYNINKGKRYARSGWPQQQPQPLHPALQHQVDDTD